MRTATSAREMATPVGQVGHLALLLQVFLFSRFISLQGREGGLVPQQEAFLCKKLCKSGTPPKVVPAGTPFLNQAEFATWPRTRGPAPAPVSAAGEGVPWGGFPARRTGGPTDRGVAGRGVCVPACQKLPCLARRPYTLKSLISLELQPEQGVCVPPCLRAWGRFGLPRFPTTGARAAGAGLGGNHQTSPK